ncbi:MAG TPA: GIY-YIG nuclease family protein [Thermomicrobiales bacterium]|nr:GIY-YIG nuclease family protein [Thermomicrobiales bacterium]
MTLPDLQALTVNDDRLCGRSADPGAVRDAPEDRGTGAGRGSHGWRRSPLLPNKPEPSAEVKTYWVYILANTNRRLYLGMTSDLERRLWEHRNNVRSWFASRYNMHRLVSVVAHVSVGDAIARGRQPERWGRDKKMARNEQLNPEWRD